MHEKLMAMFDKMDEDLNYLASLYLRKILQDD